MFVLNRRQERQAGRKARKTLELRPESGNPLGHAVRALAVWDDARLAEWEKEQRRQRQADGSQPAAS